MPSRRFPVTRRSRYRASSGVARASSPPSSSSLRPCEPGPSALAISRSVFTTVTTVSVGRPAARRRGQQLLGGLAQVADLPDQGRHLGLLDAGRGATARMASFSARPRSTPANSGAISPWHR